MTAEIELNCVDIQKLLQLLPHRYPFLMIDKVVRMRGDDFGVGIKNVTANEPQFQGHFPDNPVMPGVLMIEGMAQTGGVLAINSLPDTGTRSVFFLTIDKTKFRKIVRPGDVLEYHMTKTARRKNMWFYRGEAYVDGKLVCESELSAMCSNAEPA